MEVLNEISPDQVARAGRRQDFVIDAMIYQEAKTKTKSVLLILG